MNYYYSFSPVFLIIQSSKVHAHVNGFCINKNAFSTRSLGKEDQEMRPLEFMALAQNYSQRAVTSYFRISTYAFDIFCFKTNIMQNCAMLHLLLHIQNQCRDHLFSFRCSVVRSCIHMTIAKFLTLCLESLPQNRWFQPP